MSLRLPRRHVLHPSSTSLLSLLHFLPFLPPNCPHHHRLISLKPFRRNPRPKTLTHKDLEDLRKRPTTARNRRSGSELPETGALAPTSIFDELESQQPSTDISKRIPSDKTSTPQPRDPLTMAAALDPLPHARQRWQRKMVIRSLRGRLRLSRTEMLARTERVHVAKSALIKTSVKKLFPLARQIAGKPLEEAMVQMRFSRRKAAAEVLEHLRWARDGGVVGRGMGLGGVDALEVGGEGQEGVRKGAEGESGEGKKKGAKRIVVEDKKGKRIVVTDRSAMYVDEAWVGRGPYENGSDHRARGKINRLRLPYTSISIVLKEEASRIRLAQEREQKRKNKRVWVPLPDRPVTAQRQYPLW